MFVPRPLLAFFPRLLVIFTCLALAACTRQTAQPTTRGGVQEGETAPDFTLVTPHGEAYRLSSLRGHPVILLFWTSQCDLCRQQLLDLQSLYGRAGC